MYYFNSISISNISSIPLCHCGGAQIGGKWNGFKLYMQPFNLKSKHEEKTKKRRIMVLWPLYPVA